MTEVYFLTVLRLAVRGQGASMAGIWCSLSSWLADSCLLTVCSHDFFVHAQEEEEQERKQLSGVSSYKGTNPFMRAPPS